MSNMIQPYPLTKQIDREIFPKKLEVKFKLQMRFEGSVKSLIESPIESPIPAM